MPPAAIASLTPSATPPMPRRFQLSIRRHYAFRPVTLSLPIALMRFHYAFAAEPSPLPD